MQRGAAEGSRTGKKIALCFQGADRTRSTLPPEFVIKLHGSDCRGAAGRCRRALCDLDVEAVEQLANFGNIIIQRQHKLSGQTFDTSTQAESERDLILSGVQKKKRRKNLHERQEFKRK